MVMADKHYLETELDELIQTDPTVWQFIRESALDGVWYWDLQKPEHEWMSPELWRLFGVDPATKAHSPEAWQDLIHPDDLETAKVNLNKHLDDPNHPYDQIVRYRHADGSTVWVRCRGLAMRDEAGTPTRMLGAHIDLTALKQAQHALRIGAQDTLQTVLNTATNGIIGLSVDRQIVVANPAARHMLGGLSAPTPFSWPRNISFLEPNDLHPVDEAHNPIERALAGDKLSGEISLMTRSKGEPHRYVRIFATPVEVEETEIHTVLVIDDVSEQEAHRQQIERRSRLDALGQLTGGIAHDFNNLMATTLYAVELLKSEPITDRGKRIIDTAVASVRRGNELTNRLLAFAKRQPGAARSKPVGDVFLDLRALVEPTIEEMIDLTFVDPPSDLFVFCDQVQLDNSLLNIIINSRDAILRSGKGNSIRVEVRAVSEIDVGLSDEERSPDTYSGEGRRAVREQDSLREDGRAQRYVEFAVSDNGPGMSPEVKRRAIDPFFTTKDANSGTGLGLSVVYGFVQQSDGELRIYSEDGEGTTVRLLLPRGTAMNAKEDPVEREAMPRGRGQTILLVEDEATLLAMMRETLQMLGYNVISAPSGRNAVELIEAGTKFDLLLTDVVMPGGIGGFELARDVRQRFPDMPVIYMSGYTGFSDEEMGEVVAEMVPKPSAPSEIATKIWQALRASKA